MSFTFFVGWKTPFQSRTFFQLSRTKIAFALSLLVVTAIRAETTVGQETRFIKAGEPMLDIGNEAVPH